MGSNTPPSAVPRVRRKWRARIVADASLSWDAQRVALAVDDADGRLVVPALADHLDLSRTKVRVALAELQAAEWITVQADGFVYRIYNRGARRTAPTDPRAGRPFHDRTNR